MGTQVRLPRSNRLTHENHMDPSHGPGPLDGQGWPDPSSFPPPPFPNLPPHTIDPYQQVPVATPKSFAPRLQASWQAAPMTLRLATGMWGVAGVWTMLSPLGLIMLAVSSAARFGSSSGARLAAEVGGSTVTDLLGTLSGIAMGAMVLLLALAVAIGSIYLVVARAVLRGSMTARVVATILAGFSLLGLIGGPMMTIWVLLGVGGVICSWLPASTSHFKAMTAARHQPPLGV